MLKNINNYKYGNDCLNVQEHFDKVLTNEINQQIEKTFKEVLLKDLNIDLEQNKSNVQTVNENQTKLNAAQKKMKNSNSLYLFTKICLIILIVLSSLCIVSSILGLALGNSFLFGKIASDY
jgi:hypothetical protein